MALGQDGVAIGLEMLSAVGAALVAGYVRAKREPRVVWWWTMLARMGDAVVCGCLTVAIVSVMEWQDVRATVGVAAALGLIGTNTLSDLIVRWAERQTPKR
jgi:hypothetical protein